MTAPALVLQRLVAQRLAVPAEAKFAAAEDAVRWSGAVQAQDYGGAKWGLGLRVHGATDAGVDAAFDRGAILRTHVLRPTWHLVLPEDLRWMLELTAPRVRLALATRDRQLGIDAAFTARCLDAIARALEGGRHLTRAEVDEALAERGVATSADQRTNVLIRAEVDGVVCSGPRRGKQHTYALLEERAAPAPSSAPRGRDAALAALASRFFTSRGPATVKDFAWWSGLTLTDAKRGAASATPRLARHEASGKEYFASEAARPAGVAKRREPAAYLLPNFDELMVPYVDCDLMLDARHHAKLDARGSALLQNVILLGERVVGTWRRTLSTSTVSVVPTLFVRLDDGQKRALASAIDRYARFVSRTRA